VSAVQFRPQPPLQFYNRKSVKDENKPEDLKPRTNRYALRIIKMFSALPKTEVAKVLGRQVLRSGTSVGANYREGCRARSSAEFVSKVGDSLKELEETEYWLELLVDSATVPPRKMSALLQETDELIAIFTTISKQTKARSGLHPS
jgi:four helix bundle protein